MVPAQSQTLNVKKPPSQIKHKLRLLVVCCWSRPWGLCCIWSKQHAHNIYDEVDLRFPIVSETRIPLLLIHVLETMQRSAIKKESHRGMIDVPTWVVREHCPSLLLFSDDEGNPVMGHRVRENALNGQHRVFADPGNRVYSSAVKLLCESFCNFQRRTIKQDEGIKKLLLLSAEHMADVAEATLSLLRRDESSSADSKMDIWHFEQLIIALLVSGHPTDTYKSKGKKMPKRCRIAPKPVAIVDMAARRL